MGGSNVSDDEAERPSVAIVYSKRLKYMRRYRAEKRVYLNALKASSGCVRCGESDPYCLQFHHRDRKTKERTISRLYSGTWGMPRILSEIAKCDVICANCHLKLHRTEDELTRKP